jgi:hypothetical protein
MKFIVNQRVDVFAIKGKQTSDPVLVSEMRGTWVLPGWESRVAGCSAERKAILGVERNVVVVGCNQFVLAIVPLDQSGRCVSDV